MKDNDKELFAEVDAEGNVIGQITRWEAHHSPDRKPLHAVVHLHPFNADGDLYMQHRPEWKDIQPGKWDTACGGHVDYGETIGNALAREVREELGVENIEGTVFMGKYVFESARERGLVYVHRLTYDGAVNPSADELDGGRFFSQQEIADLMGNGFFTPNFESEYRRFFL